MAESIEFSGGPCAGTHSFEGALLDIQTFTRNSVDGVPASANMVVYRLDRSGVPPRYDFLGIGRPSKFRGGPLDGRDETFIGTLPIIFEAQHAGPTGKIIGLTRYELKEMAATGPAFFEVIETVDLETEEDKALAAIYQFYKEPDPNIYSIKPGLHKEIWIEAGLRRASVDEEIADVIRAVWNRGWETIGSCQERPPESDYHGLAYISFPLAGHGLEFAAALAAAGIEHQTTPKKFHFARGNNKTEDVEKREIDGLAVFFHKRDFEAIVTALSKNAQESP